MHKMLLATLAASTVSIAAVPAGASTYVFTYATDGNSLSGSFSGTLGSDQNSFTITGLNSFTINGLPVAGMPTVVGTDMYTFGAGAGPTATLDASKLDFTITSGPNQSFIVGVGDGLAAALGSARTELTIPYGGSGYLESFNRAAYSASIAAVPEAGTWAMMIVGFGVAGAALRRRRLVVRFA